MHSEFKLDLEKNQKKSITNQTLWQALRWKPNIFFLKDYICLVGEMCQIASKIWNTPLNVIFGPLQTIKLKIRNRRLDKQTYSQRIKCLQASPIVDTSMNKNKTYLFLYFLIRLIIIEAQIQLTHICIACHWINL